MKDYEMVVGLEVHAELNTKSKIYCNCRNAFGLEVNSQVCPVCMGMPGTLPTLNEKVVEYAIKMGHAMHCQINGVCKQDRKNYFYPDLPKAYQISQAEVPLCGEGYLDVMVDGKMKRIGVTRIHIEEDAGKLLHDESFSGSLVDLNRCGVPLIEIVSEPDIRSSAACGKGDGRRLRRRHVAGGRRTEAGGRRALCGHGRCCGGGQHQARHLRRRLYPAG